jgi:hypothetical protein
MPTTSSYLVNSSGLSASMDASGGSITTVRAVREYNDERIEYKQFWASCHTFDARYDTGTYTKHQDCVVET